MSYGTDGPRRRRWYGRAYHRAREVGVMRVGAGAGLSSIGFYKAVNFIFEAFEKLDGAVLKQEWIVKRWESFQQRHERIAHRLSGAWNWITWICTTCADNWDSVLLFLVGI